MGHGKIHLIIIKSMAHGTLIFNSAYLFQFAYLFAAKERRCGHTQDYYSILYFVIYGYQHVA